jgi:hypothetical protein
VPAANLAGSALTMIIAAAAPPSLVPKDALSQPDDGEIPAIAIPESVPLPLFTTATVCCGGLAPPLTPEKLSVLGDSCSTGLVLNLALTATACFIVSVHEPWPEQAPPHPPNTSLPAAVAVSVTEALGANGALHVPLVVPLRIVHAMPAGAEVTDPLPSPAAVIVRTGGGVGGATVKVTRTASVPPFVLETPIVAVYVPAVSLAGLAPTLIVVPDTTALSHGDGGVMLETATPDSVPLPALVTVTIFRAGLVPPETAEKSSVLGDSRNTGFVLNLALTPNACPILSVQDA